jgi:hypothetical protein
MDGFRHLPTQFLSWPYHGSTDEDQDAHEALEWAAASLQADPSPPPRRRGRPPRTSPPAATGGNTGAARTHGPGR